MLYPPPFSRLRVRTAQHWEWFGALGSETQKCTHVKQHENAQCSCKEGNSITSICHFVFLINPESVDLTQRKKERKVIGGPISLSSHHRHLSYLSDYSSWASLGETRSPCYCFRTESPLTPPVSYCLCHQCLTVCAIFALWRNWETSSSSPTNPVQ